MTPSTDMHDGAPSGPTPAQRPGAPGTVRDDASAGESETAQLGRVCDLLMAAVPAAAAAVVLVDEQLAPIAAAARPDDLRAMVASQFERGEGPCVYACRTGDSVVEIDVVGAPFRHWAVAAGWQAVHTLPVRIDGRTAGVVTIASLRRGGLTPAESETARGIGAIATAHAATLRALRGAQQMTAQLQHALHNRVEIEHAKGMVAQRLDVTVDEAFAIMRLHARDERQTLADVARGVVLGCVQLNHRETGDVRTSSDRVASDVDADRSDAVGQWSLLSIVQTQAPGSARLIGEADLSTDQVLAQALAELAEDQGDITLDLGDLTFIDAHSIGLLVRAATALPPSRRLVLRRTSGIVARVLSILHIADHPRIRIL